MSLVLSAWPVFTLLLPALVLVSALVFWFQGNRRAVGHLLALLACFFIGALVMEFFVFTGALMARSGGRAPAPVLGAGTQMLLSTLADPRSVTASPRSLPALAAYSILVAYGGLAVVWGLHLRGKKPTPAKRKQARAPRKAAKA